MPPETDCVVVGAGLVGSAAAVMLARQGYAVTVVERRTPRAAAAADVRALALSAASVRVLQQTGMWSRLAAQAVPIREIRVSEQGAFASVRLSARDVGLEALGWACPADVLLQEANAALADCAGVKVRWSTHFTGARSGAERVEVALRSDRGEERVQARVLIGADGAGSAVREQAGIGVARCDYAQQAIVLNLRALRPLPPATALEHFTREGPLAFIPLGGDRYVSVQCLAEAHVEAALASSPQAYLAMLERRCGERLGRLREPGARRAHRLVRQRARALVTGRIALAGNAANTVHPNAAQGLNLGLRDVAALARHLGGGDPGRPGALAAYAAARHPDHALIGGFTHVLAQGFTSSLGPLRCARRTALLLAAHARPLRARLARELTGLGALAHIEAAS